MQMKSILHEIPLVQLIVYYAIIIVLYLVFLRDVKATFITIILIIQFNMGIIDLFTENFQIVKLVVGLVSVLVLFKAKKLNIDKRDIMVIVLFALFLVLLLSNNIYYSTAIKWAFMHLYKYLIPVVVYFGVRYSGLGDNSQKYYSDLLLRLILLQIPFSIAKLVVIGFRENIVGSVVNAGGDVSIAIALWGLLLLWHKRNKQIVGKDWRYVILLLLIPASCDKRAIWFLYPIVLMFISYEYVTRIKLQQIVILTLLMPIVLYAGLRINPSLNPEKKMWGSFDLTYAIDYAMDYSGVSDDKLSSEYGQGRWGSTLVIIKSVASVPFSSNSLLGMPRTEDAGVDLDMFDADFFRVELSGNMISFLGRIIIFMGWPASLLFILMQLKMIDVIEDKSIRRIFKFVFFWDVVLYTGMFTLSVIWVFVLIHLSKKNSNDSSLPSLYNLA